MFNDEVLICRRCKVEAHAHLINGEIASITCPSCGVLVEGDAARKMYLEEASYLAIKEAQDAFGRGFRKGGPIKYQPGRLSKPSGPFTIGKPKA